MSLENAHALKALAYLCFQRGTHYKIHMIARPHLHLNGCARDPTSVDHKGW